MSKNTRNRILLTALAALLLVVVAVGSTVAYLQASTKTITNTFKAASIANLTLIEHEYDADNHTLKSTTTQANANYQFIPGVDLPKDPTLNAEADVPYYVFVKVTISNWPTTDKISKKMFYETDTTWTKLEGATTEENTAVYYKALDANVKITDLQLITDNKITVSADLDKTTLEGITGNIQMEFTAYAIQQSGFENALAAWNQMKSTIN